MVSVDVCFKNVSVFVLFCVLGDIKPTHYQRECSCSQLTPLSSLFTGVSEGRKPAQIRQKVNTRSYDGWSGEGMKVVCSARAARRGMGGTHTWSR